MASVAFPPPAGMWAETLLGSLVLGPRQSPRPPPHCWRPGHLCGLQPV